MSADNDSVDTILVSDIHLGSELSLIREFLDFVGRQRVGPRSFRFRRLILVGDIFDGLEPHLVREGEREFVDLLTDMIGAQPAVEVVWLYGNHDPALPESVASLPGLKHGRECRWTTGGHRCFALHGDQYGDWLLRLPPDVVNDADGYAWSINAYVASRGIKADAIFFGHTHVAERRYFRQSDNWSFNTGCWYGVRTPTFVTVSAGGTVEIREYRAPPASTGPA